MLPSFHDACAVLIVALLWDVSETKDVMLLVMSVVLVDVSLTAWNLAFAIATGYAVVSVQAFATAVTKWNSSNLSAM